MVVVVASDGPVLSQCWAQCYPELLGPLNLGPAKIATPPPKRIEDLLILVLFSYYYSYVV